ncbi:CAP domain-containing protein [Niallia sp. MER TA 168]|uniref:CAP domain-containing protein n=1 Tax=Niallia sp. MER TA 168 TaxID=2939568 RepID=UPI002040C29B|nr:CAP domain-containing protein [Niallia sp. MER TA 168]MCM3362099.1 CAP domain-containing protein [Niallia sp. MER TA 168]
MKVKNIFSILACMPFLVLAGCNNTDREAMDWDSNHRYNEDTISSLTTNVDSKKYPHTQPIKVQDAKYEFRTIVGTYEPNAANRQNQKATPKQQTNQRAQPAPQTTPSTNADDKKEPSNFVASVIDLTNAERKKQGLPALQAYPELNNVADMKAKDMNDKGYFSHTSPTYGSPFDMMRDFGITYQSAGENIAQGQRSPEEVVEAWMNSEGHRANILNDKYTHIGVGFDEGGYEWVQMFVKK